MHFFSAQGSRVDTKRIEYTVLVWNVTPAFQHRALHSIHLCFSVATRSLAAFTDPHSWFYCAGFFFFFFLEEEAP